MSKERENIDNTLPTFQMIDRGPSTLSHSPSPPSPPPYHRAAPPTTSSL